MIYVPPSVPSQEPADNYYELEERDADVLGEVTRSVPGLLKPQETGLIWQGKSQFRAVDVMMVAPRRSLHQTSTSLRPFVLSAFLQFVTIGNACLLMILGVGLDIVHLPRIASLLARRGPERFAHRILSQKELPEWSPSHPDSLRFLAVRFSVKEAAYKALYPTCRPTWKELSYLSFGRKCPGSKPELLYEPTEASLRDKVGRVHVSVSHDGEYVTSTVVAETPTNTRSL